MLDINIIRNNLYYLLFPHYFENTLWQLCSGIDENAVGACAQLVFAPIDESFADNAPLLPSGFRVIPLDSKPVMVIFQPSSSIFFHIMFVFM